MNDDVIIDRRRLSGSPGARAVHATSASAAAVDGARRKFQRLGVGLNLHPSCRARTDPARAATGAGAPRRRDQGDELQPAWRVHLLGAARPLRRLFAAAVLDPSRPISTRCWRMRSSERPRWRHRDGHRCIGVTQDDDGVTVHRAGGSGTALTGCASGRRRSPARHRFGGPQAAFPERRIAGLSRRQHVARGVALEAVPVRRHQGAGRLDRHWQEGDLSALAGTSTPTA